MQTMNLKIEDSFYPHFQAIIESFIKDKKVTIVKKSGQRDFEVSSIEEVQQRVHAAEKRISTGHYVNEEQYRREMDEFLKEL